MLTRAKPMNPTGEANEGRARKPPKKGGGQFEGYDNVMLIYAYT
jgi:hypothetical protein